MKRKGCEPSCEDDIIFTEKSRKKTHTYIIVPHHQRLRILAIFSSEERWFDFVNISCKMVQSIPRILCELEPLQKSVIVFSTTNLLTGTFEVSICDDQVNNSTSFQLYRDAQYKKFYDSQMIGVPKSTNDLPSFDMKSVDEFIKHEFNRCMISTSSQIEIDKIPNLESFVWNMMDISEVRMIFVVFKIHAVIKLGDNDNYNYGQNHVNLLTTVKEYYDFMQALDHSQYGTVMTMLRKICDVFSGQYLILTQDWQAHRLQMMLFHKLNDLEFGKIYDPQIFKPGEHYDRSIIESFINRDRERWLHSMNRIDHIRSTLMSRDELLTDYDQKSNTNSYIAYL